MRWAGTHHQAASALLGERCGAPGQSAAQFLERRPAEADAHVGIGHPEPVALADVGAVVLQQRAIEPTGVEPGWHLQAREAHHAAGRLDPFEARLIRQPAPHDAESLANARRVRREPGVALPQGRECERLVHDRTADPDLLLRREKAPLQEPVARDEPADAYARDSIGLGYRGDADESLAEACGRRIGRREGEVPVGLIDQYVTSGS